MPLGRYRVTDRAGAPVGTEEFRCAPGPMGWRYFSQISADDPERPDATVDIVVDAAWRPVRARIEIGAHSILVTAEPTRLAGFLDREPVEIPLGPPDGVSPTHRRDSTPSPCVIGRRRTSSTWWCWTPSPARRAGSDADARPWATAPSIPRWDGSRLADGASTPPEPKAPASCGARVTSSCTRTAGTSLRPTILA